MAQLDRLALAHLLESIEGCAYAVDVTAPGRYILAGMNRRHAEVTGCEPEAAIGRSIEVLAPPRTVSILREQFRRCLESRSAVCFDVALPMSGERSWWHTVLTPLACAGGTTRILATAQQLSRQAMIETRLGFLADMVAATSAGVYVMDPEQPGCPVIFVNAAFLRITRTRREEVLGRPCRFVCGPGEGDPAQLLRARMAIERRDAMAFELAAKRGDGETFFAELSLNPVRGANGELDLYVGMIADITERRHAEAFMEAVFDRSGSGISITDADGRFIRVNEAWQRIYGYSEKEVRGRHFAMIAGEEQRARAIEEHRRYLAGEDGLMEGDWPIRRKDGSAGVVTIKSGRFTGPNGRNYRISTIVDVTEARRIEHHYKAIVEDQIELICRFGPDLKLTFVNGAFAAFCGREPEALAGTALDSLSSRLDPQQMRRRLATATPQRPVFREEFRAIARDGTMRWQLWTVRAFFDGAGKAIEYQAIGVDITEQKRLEVELRAASRAAQEANQAKSTFLARMSHDLRTPLNAIIGFSQIMREEMFGPLGSPRYQAYADDIVRSGEHLLDLINDILDLSRLEAGRRELDEQVLDVPTLVADAKRLVAGQAEARGLKLTSRLEPDLPPLAADPRALRQILLNVLGNAIKFTPEGGRITIKADADVLGLHIAITDTGIGIAAEDCERVLQPFTQATSSPALAAQGSGLGLAIVDSLMTLHDGRVHLASKPGRGTTVTLSFPPARLRPLLRRGHTGGRNSLVERTAS